MTNNLSSKYTKLILIVFSLAILSCISTPIFAGQLYRYKNAQGNQVLNQSVPAEFVSQGYDILNEQGRVIKVIAPALSAEEISLRDAAIAREELRLIEKQKQDVIDQELKQLYSHPNDGVRVLKRRIQDINDVVQIKNSKISSIRNVILQEEATAAERQRKGLNVQDVILTKIENLKKEIEHTKADISELNQESDKVFREFDVIIRRLEVITKKQATDYTELLNSIQPKPVVPLENKVPLKE